jgi:hypothetical protein
VQRREGFTGSYTITAPSFTVVGNAYFFPLTPLQPPEGALRAIRRSEPAVGLGAAGHEDGKTGGVMDRGLGLDLGGSDHGPRVPSQLHRTARTNATMYSNARIRHAYPHYDVENGFFPDPLSSL